MELQGKCVCVVWLQYDGRCGVGEVLSCRGNVHCILPS